MSVHRLLIILSITLGLLFMLPTPTRASEDATVPNPAASNPQESSFELLSLLPAISTYARSGFGLYRSTACPCFDRQTWALDLGINLQWHRFIGFDAEYRFGTMILGGNFPTSGYALGIRSGLTPEPTRWWDNFYVRAGVGWLSTMGAREDNQIGIYLHPGWAIELFPILHLETEISTAYNFGPMEHFNIGFRSGLRFGF